MYILLGGQVNHAHSITLKDVTVQVNRYINRSWNNNVAVFLYYWRQHGQPFAIHPLYYCRLVYTSMISSPSGKEAQRL